MNKKTKVNIERAGIRDLAELLIWRLRVLEEVFAPLPGDDERSLYNANRRYYEWALNGGHNISCFAVAENGEKVGCGSVCLQSEMPSPDNPTGRCGYLMNIYVAPEYRRQGIAAQIVQWLVSQARELGADKIYLESSLPGIPLYRKLGFKLMPEMMKL